MAPAHSTLIYTCGMPSLPLMVRQLLAASKDETHIVIFDTTRDDQAKGRACIQGVLAEHGSRLTRVKAPAPDPSGLETWCKDNSDIDLITKIDDDVICVGDDVVQAMRDALEAEPAALFTSVFTPLQSGLLWLLAERGYTEVEPFFTQPNLMDAFRHLNPPGRYRALQRFWRQTTPTDAVREALLTGPRYVRIPDGVLDERRWSTYCYTAHRERILDAFEADRASLPSGRRFRESPTRGAKDEDGFDALRRDAGRAVVVDTHTVAYHLSWYFGRAWSERTLLPQMEHADDLATWQYEDPEC